MPFTTQVFNEVGPIGLPFDANMSVRRYVVPWNHGNGSSLSSRSVFSKSEYQKYSQNDSIIDSCTARNRWVFSISLPQSLLLVNPPPSPWGLRCLRLTFRSDPSMLPRKEPCAKLVRHLGGIDFRNLRSNHRKWVFFEDVDGTFVLNSLDFFEMNLGVFILKTHLHLGLKLLKRFPAWSILQGQASSKCRRWKLRNDWIAPWSRWSLGGNGPKNIEKRHHFASRHQGEGTTSHIFRFWRLALLDVWPYC